MTERNKNFTDANDEMTKKDLPIREIINAVRSVRFGTVQIIIQDSRIVQIERTEKLRLDRKAR